MSASRSRQHSEKPDPESRRAIDVIRVRPISAGRVQNESWLVYREGDEIRVLNARQDVVAIVRQSVAGQRITVPVYSDEVKNPSIELDIGIPKYFEPNHELLSLLRDFVLEVELVTGVNSPRTAICMSIIFFVFAIGLGIGTYYTMRVFRDDGDLSRWQLKIVITLGTATCVAVSLAVNELLNALRMKKLCQ